MENVSQKIKILNIFMGKKQMIMLVNIENSMRVLMRQIRLIKQSQKIFKIQKSKIRLDSALFPFFNFLLMQISSKSVKKWPSYGSPNIQTDIHPSFDFIIQRLVNALRLDSPRLKSLSLNSLHRNTIYLNSIERLTSTNC